MFISQLDIKELKRIQKKAEFVKRCTDSKNPFDIAKANGVRIVITELADGLPAFIDKLADGTGCTIYIDSSADTYSQKILCAHELGHFFIDTENQTSLFDTSINSVSEFKANLFMWFLMPQVLSIKDVRCCNTTTSFNQLVASKVMIDGEALV